MMIHLFFFPLQSSRCKWTATLQLKYYSDEEAYLLSP